MQAKIQEEHLLSLQDKEQQALLALEEMELQKKAIQTQTENQLQEMQQELEECRTVCYLCITCSFYCSLEMLAV